MAYDESFPDRLEENNSILSLDGIKEIYSEQQPSGVYYPRLGAYSERLYEDEYKNRLTKQISALSLINSKRLVAVELVNTDTEEAALTLEDAEQAARMVDSMSGDEESVKAIGMFELTAPMIVAPKSDIPGYCYDERYVPGFSSGVDVGGQPGMTTFLFECSADSIYEMPSVRQETLADMLGYLAQRPTDSD